MNLTPTEEYLLNYMNSHPEELSNISITRLSEITNSSTASIIRTVKKLGYSGFTDYKLSLKENISQPTYDNLKKFDNQIQNVILQNEEEVVKTIKNLDSSVIEDSLQYIKQADNIYLFAVGLSTQVATEMELKLNLLHKHCELYTDPKLIKTISRRPTEFDISIIISLSGHTEYLIEASETMRKNEVPIILISANEKSPLFNLSTIQLIGHKSMSNLFTEFEVQSRLPLFVITRILLDAYAIRFSKSI